MAAKNTERTTQDAKRNTHNQQPTTDNRRPIIGITVKKSNDPSEWYTQAIQKADLIEYGPVSGCIIFKPNSYAVWEKVQEWFNAEIKKLGVKNCYFPMFIPESFFKREASHVEGFKAEVAWVTQGGDSKLAERLAVRPTSETIMYDAFSKWIRSYRDLPLKINQWCNIVRWEFKHPTPFLRGREFLWQEGHTAHATEDDAMKMVLAARELYRRIAEELLAIPAIVGKKSEKDKFAGAKDTYSVETFLPIGKAIQIATSHNLGQNFAKVFNVSFLDEKGQKQYCWQTSWGISTRTIGILVLVHGDDKGLVLPPKIAPVKAVIVPIYFNENDRQKVLKSAKELHSKLGADVILDDRSEYTPGWKFNDWEMKGVPVRIELGPKDIAAGKAVFVRRDTGTKESVKIADAGKRLQQLFEDIQKSLLAKAKKFLNEATVEAKDWKQFTKAIADKKFVKAQWCGTPACEDWIKDKTEGAKSISIPDEQPKKQSGKCVQCGKPAIVVAFFAKSY